MTARSLRRRALPTALVLLVGVVACTGDDGGAASASCEREVREAVDPGTAQHVLAGAGDDGLDYRSDPPTSGPHTPGPAFDGQLDGPLDRPTQVGHLEAGGVLFQHDGLDDEQVDALVAAVADLDDVAVAPATDLPAAVVATGWLVKQTCDAVDADAVRTFAEAHLGAGPGTD